MLDWWWYVSSVTGFARPGTDDIRRAEHDRAHGVSHSDTHAVADPVPKSSGKTLDYASNIRPIVAFVIDAMEKSGTNTLIKMFNT